MTTTRSTVLSPRSKGNAFTLIELLVSISVIVVLLTLGLGGLKEALKRGEGMREYSGGKTLISAYLNHAAENNGQLMVAHYEGQAAEADALQVKLPDGTVLTGGALHRYPFRLSPYFDYNINGVILINQNRKQVGKKFSGSMYHYGASLCPSFGINYYFVGGYVVDNELAGAADCVTRLSQAEKPSSLLVFASSFQDVEGERFEGRFGVEPPRYRTELWEENLHVDPRHGGKVLCAFLDGSLRLQTVDELRDMRLWSRQASLLNDPNYTVATAGSGGAGGPGGGRR